MADIFTKSKRSQIMAAIRGKGNRTTEWRLRSRMMQSGMKGWKVASNNVARKPDFLFERDRVAVFVDGCFWHGCSLCRNIPASNHSFWLKKIRSNKDRDTKVTRTLRKIGWRVVRFWEHEIKKNPGECIPSLGVLLKPGRNRSRSNKS